MKKFQSGKAKSDQVHSQGLPGDDGFLKVSTLKRTLFFLSLVANPPKNKPDISITLQEMAHDLLEELAIEVNNCIQMQAILYALTDKIGAAHIAEILNGTPDEIERGRRVDASRPTPDKGQGL